MDRELVERARQGDREAFTTIAAEAYARFHRVAFAVLRDRELAQDAVQAAMLQTWRELPGLRDPARFEAWAYRLLIHACYAEGKRHRRHLPNVMQERDEPASVDVMGVVADRDQLERAFRHLPMEQRAVVVLHHLADQPLPRVAEILGIPEGTARSRDHRAMQTLRGVLEADRPPATASAPVMPNGHLEVRR